jgi:SAM-dependent methyltransferase
LFFAPRARREGKKDMSYIDPKNPPPRRPARRSAVRTAPVFLGLALALGCSSSGEPVAPEDRAAVTARIQRECLRAYPPDLLARMTKRAEESIPPEVDADPNAQPEFLNRDLEVSKGIFYPSYLEELRPAFERYLAPGSRFLDLGSGDGRVVFLANVLGADAVGIEWEEELVAVSHRAMEQIGDPIVPGRIHFIQGDFFETSWADFDVIFYFGSGSSNLEGIQAKLRAEMSPEARVIIAHEGHRFDGFEIEARFPSVKVLRWPAAPE